jgi:hypothetical protein
MVLKKGLWVTSEFKDLYAKKRHYYESDCGKSKFRKNIRMKISGGCWFVIPTWTLKIITWIYLLS